jgi:hypothetical protein
MSKCPCCKRAFRKLKPKEETKDEAFKRIMAQTRAKIVTSLKKPMPKSTPHKGD